jgi:hypothetical protein
MQIARVYIRNFSKYDIVHGTFARFIMEDGSFTQYKRFFFPAAYYKYDDDRIVFTSECSFIMITAIGSEEIGMELGEMDAWMTMGNIPDLEKIVSYVGNVKSKVIIALFEKDGDGFRFSGEIKSVNL